MTDNVHDCVRNKVQALFTEWAGDRARLLQSNRFPAEIADTIIAALANPGASSEHILRVSEIVFHLTDWNADAAFLVALHLFPERFTPEEIDAAVDSLLVHVPAHVIAAARLAGHSTEDSFREDAVDET